MPILIVYASTGGQTRKIARFAAGAGGIEAGHLDGPILAGSVHAGPIQDSLTAFWRADPAAPATRSG